MALFNNQNQQQTNGEGINYILQNAQRGVSATDIVRDLLQDTLTQTTFDEQIAPYGTYFELKETQDKNPQGLDLFLEVVKKFILTIGSFSLVSPLDLVRASLAFERLSDIFTILFSTLPMGSLFYIEKLMRMCETGFILPMDTVSKQSFFQAYEDLLFFVRYELTHAMDGVEQIQTSNTNVSFPPPPNETIRLIQQKQETITHVVALWLLYNECGRIYKLYNLTKSSALYDKAVVQRAISNRLDDVLRLSSNGIRNEYRLEWMDSAFINRFPTRCVDFLKLRIIEECIENKRMGWKNMTLLTYISLFDDKLKKVAPELIDTILAEADGMSYIPVQTPSPRYF